MRDEMEPCFREELVDLWNGKLFQQREVVNYTLVIAYAFVTQQFGSPW